MSILFFSFPVQADYIIISGKQRAGYYNLSEAAFAISICFYRVLHEKRKNHWCVFVLL